MTATPISGLRGKIGILERRLAYLERRIEEKGRGDAAKDYDRAEASALRAAIMALDDLVKRREQDA